MAHGILLSVCYNFETSYFVKKILLIEITRLFSGATFCAHVILPIADYIRAGCPFFSINPLTPLGVLDPSQAVFFFRCSGVYTSPSSFVENWPEF